MNFGKRDKIFGAVSVVVIVGVLFLSYVLDQQYQKWVPTEKTFFLGEIILSYGNRHYYYNGTEGDYISFGVLSWIDDAKTFNATLYNRYRKGGLGSFRFDGFEPWIGFIGCNATHVTLKAPWAVMDQLKTRDTFMNP